MLALSPTELTTLDRDCESQLAASKLDQENAEKERDADLRRRYPVAFRDNLQRTAVVAQQPVSAATAPRRVVSAAPVAAPVASLAPRAEWAAAIDDEIARGVPRRKAASNVARKNPELRQAMVAAVNADRPVASAQRPATAPRTAATQQPVSSPTSYSGDARQQWLAAIDVERLRGLSQREAVRRAARKHPGLREQMVAAAN